MKVAIVGSRDYPSRSVVARYVRHLPDEDTNVSGGAKGVDTWAAAAARTLDHSVIEYPVDTKDVGWLQYSAKISWRQAFAKVAHARNKVIAEVCDRLVAFSFDKSRGTASTIRYARNLGKPVEVYEWPDVPKVGA